MKYIDTFIIRTKALVRKNFSPATVKWVRRLLGRHHFDEVDAIYEILAEKCNTKLMIDVGAHYGESFGSFLFDGWDIYAFEPDSENMKILNVFANSRGKLVLDKRGCSNISAKNQSFFRSDISSGISSLSSFHSSHFGSSQIDTITISDYVEEQQITDIGFLKIDTEGHDLFVLQGVPWEKIKPEIIVAEFEDKKTRSLGYDYHQMANLLSDQGYIVLISEWHPIESYGQKHKWNRLERYPYNLSNDSGWGNIIAILDYDLVRMLEAKYSF
jgi:FkbM family methyltransferase